MPNLSLRRNYDVDIIIRGSGKVPVTRRLLRSIQASAPKLACQLIYIDGGSDRQDLAQLMLDRQEVIYLSLPYNAGAVRGINLGLSMALMSNAPYVLLVDNDVEVPKDAGDWLERLIAHFDNDRVGAVGAVSDHATGPQQTPAGVAVNIPGDVPVLDDFALMVRKSAIGQAGLFDERFEPGLFEDVDYSIRLHDLGWQLRVAGNVWLAHTGAVTLGKFDGAALMQANVNKLAEKHGVEKLKRYGMEIVEQAPVEPDKRKISLLVPTLNRPEKLRAMLESVRPLVEDDGNIEVVIAPMDEKDLPAAIWNWVTVAPRPESERYAVPGFNWCFKHATGDILVVGGDDVLYNDPTFFKVVREEIAQLPNGEGMVDGRDGPVEALQALTRGFIETELKGVFMPGGYRSWWANVEQTARAERAKQHRITDRAHVSSTNPILDGSTKDETYLTGEQWHAKDQARFVARMAAGFPDEWSIEQ